MDYCFSYDNDVIGMPDIQAEYFDGMQIWDDTCAVAAESSLIRQFGFDISEGEAAYISASNGWYQPGGGTSPDVIGNLMDLYDIDNHTVMNASLSDLAQELSQGHGVIVGVRSDQLWDQGAGFELKNFICEALGIDTSEYLPADHAIVVTGLDLSDPDNPMVLINDSGVPNGIAQAYPLDRFMDAWENSDFYYTATNDTLPSMMDDMNSSEWNDINWGSWIGAGAGLTVGAFSLLETGDIELSTEIGAATYSVIESIFAEESFVRNI